jgi:predicted nucleic acid-binding protein
MVLGDQDLVIAPPLTLKLPDPDDLMFLEVAASAGEGVLVTGNLRHFPAKSRGSVRVLSPAEAWALRMDGGWEIDG